jgi:hypothetical protein
LALRLELEHMKKAKDTAFALGFLNVPLMPLL